MRKISQDRTVHKVTKIKECGTQTATKKTGETENVNSPSRCSEKPVAALQANLVNGKLSVFKENRSVQENQLVLVGQVNRLRGEIKCTR